MCYSPGFNVNFNFFFGKLDFAHVVASSIFLPASDFSIHYRIMFFIISMGRILKVKLNSLRSTRVPLNCLFAYISFAWKVFKLIRSKLGKFSIFFL